jgi:pSer/pThr/pTyr-binding forkhead associated (FHA) protein
MTQGADGPDLTGVPHLIVLAPDASRGRLIEISGDYLTVGRESTSDVRFDDPHVSRTHAALERRGDAVYVKDLGSSGGTYVNGAPVTRAELHGGDVVAFAAVHARFVAAQKAAEETRAMPTQAVPPQAMRAQAMPAQAMPAQAVPSARPVPARPVPVEPPLAGPLLTGPPPQAGPPLRAEPAQAEPESPGPPPAGDGKKVPVAHYIAPPQAAAERPMIPPTGVVPAVPGAAHPGGRPQGEAAGLAGRDRYEPPIARQRDRALRKAAATRTKARWLTWPGLLFLVVGSGLFVAADLGYLKQVGRSIRSGTAIPSSMGHLGRPIGGVPEGALGLGIAAFGALLLIFGIVCYIIAGSRRRRAEREYPLPVR